MHSIRVTVLCLLLASVPRWTVAADLDTLDPACYHDGDLAGSLKTDQPLPLYHPDPQHITNRLFAACYIRTSNLPTKRGGKTVSRIEGGDVIDFLAWAKSTYWSEPATCEKISLPCWMKPSRIPLRLPADRSPQAGRPAPRPWAPRFLSHPQPRTGWR
ncbi:MAG: hypothetical protein U0903_15770 [Planctomycetales bacterium]